MDFVDLTTGINDNDRRIDKIIKIAIPNLSLGDIYKSLRKGLIKLNNKKTTAQTHIKTGDIINVASFLLESNNINDKKIQNQTENNKKYDSKQNFIPKIVFQNQHILIINKPYDFLVQANNTNEIPLDKIIQDFYIKNNDIKSISFTPGPLHRLDKKTTGLLCFSWSLDGAKWFSNNIQNHTITKKYRGIVQGKIPAKQIWTDFIDKNYDENKKFQTVITTNTNEPNAYTEVTPISYGTFKNMEVTYAEFDIKTGKTHQIRAQSSFHGFPLLGDTAYGAKKLNLKREYFLHAYELNFPENNLEIPNKVICPISGDMKELLFNTCNINL